MIRVRTVVVSLSCIIYSMLNVVVHCRHALANCCAHVVNFCEAPGATLERVDLSAHTKSCKDTTPGLASRPSFRIFAISSLVLPASRRRTGPIPASRITIRMSAQLYPANRATSGSTDVMSGPSANPFNSVCSSCVRASRSGSGTYIRFSRRRNSRGVCV